ncbi:YmgG-like glycine-zipper protein [Mucilaginibacter yixingensis]|uniref:YmgG-like glycine-zipper protein n=1 Tax=Mucilaginibacter yixingensis TaxID=1295612 RepID=A0A2T5J6N2_9SPHI|nr:YMGG-like glycine zipper-containing protein [Mucilaginibacter yixingensis]PTQ94121.1 YmgG-like glycine-zipper protein [Mucilaginibacter yixingensis]
MKKLFFCFTIISAMMFTALSTQSMAQEHKKMSSQAKGAIIGGAGGAVAGGLIGHGVKGALIGGAIGAGGGYIIGNEHRRHVEKVQRAQRRAYWRRHHTVTHPSHNVTVIRKH